MKWFKTARRTVAPEAGTGVVREAVQRPRIARILFFGGVVLSTFSVAVPATAWPMCGT